MTIKSILCIFGGEHYELNALNTACQLAQAHGARIRFLHLSPSPAHMMVYVEGFMANVAMTEALEKENMQRMQMAKKHVITFADRYQIPMNMPQAAVHHVTGRFLHVTGFLEETIAREGRVSDLIIMGRAISEQTSYDQQIRAALFDTGRPVLLLPPDASKELTPWRDRIVALAWDGGLESARALYNALPLIGRVEQLHVLSAREHHHHKIYSPHVEQSLMDYLQAHGVKTEICVFDCHDRSYGEGLMLKAKELGVQLMVMGAFGHARMREMVLGGVTRFMLEEADIPLLLSH